MNPPLHDLARRHAIATEYTLIGGETRTPPPETLERLLAAFGVDPDREESLADAATELRAPSGVRCHLPREGTRQWGVALQLYQLRSARNWGIGDFADLAEIGRLLGSTGADFVGLNPLHALFLANPAHCSPFSPSNRRFLNPLYIAPDRVEGFALLPDEAMPDPEAMRAARAGDRIDYAAVAEAKLPVLRKLWHIGTGDPDFDEFRKAGGRALQRHAVFEAISFHMVAQGHGAGWHGWPEQWQDVNGPTVADFGQTHAGEVAFHLWLQWQADRQLRAARAACLEAGMRIGLYLDFAVGEAPDGSGTWSAPQSVLRHVRIGAPPDYFNAAGQDWGLAPLSPRVIAERHAEPFRDLMEDATRRAGALRIDHAMGLWQLFLIPDGMTAADGTYARYPIEDMLRTLAQASNDHSTIIIGEDLGNVPDGFREVMEAAGILSYRILFFERNENGFISPEDYPQGALTCLSTHDLPTFRGWWLGDDVSLRAHHGLIGEAAAMLQAEERVTERAQLLDVLRDAGLLALDHVSPDQDPPAALTVAVHRYLARAPSMLFAARLEDIAGERAPVNLPSTLDEYPNWRLRLGTTLEELPHAPLWQAIAAALSTERPRKEGE